MKDRKTVQWKGRTALLLAAAALLAASCSGVALSGSGDFAKGLPATMPDLSAKAAGDYQGSYTIALPAGAIAMSRRWDVTVTVDAATAKVTAIAVDYPASYPDAGMIDALKARVIAAQSLDIDAFSGATYSSKAFCKAVEDALSD